MNKFRLLHADEIECRIAQIKDNGLSLLLYKTARTDADLLDETVGPEYWENDFKLVDGVLYGGIGIDFEKNGKLVWKWDAGTESNTEAEKGRASDAFKRAGFKHGIGRELYSAPFIWIGADKCNIQNRKCNDQFAVVGIGYDDKGRITDLAICEEKSGRCVYSMGKFKNSSKPEPNPEAPKDTKFRCTRCKKELVPYPGKSGEMVSLRAHSEKSMKLYGTVLCLDCIKSRQEEAVTE